MLDDIRYVALEKCFEFAQIVKFFFYFESRSLRTINNESSYATPLTLRKTVALMMNLKQDCLEWKR